MNTIDRMNNLHWAIQDIRETILDALEKYQNYDINRTEYLAIIVRRKAIARKMVAKWHLLKR